MPHVGRQYPSRGFFASVCAGTLFTVLFFGGGSFLGLGAEIPVKDVPSLMNCASGVSSAPGDICMVQSGSYKLSSPLRITVDNLIVRCVDAPPACRIDGDGTGNNVQILAHRVQFGEIGGGFQLENIGAASAITLAEGLEGVVIQGNQIVPGASGYQHGIELLGDQRFLRIIDNTIENPSDNFDCIAQEIGGLSQAEFRGNTCSTDKPGSRGIDLLGNAPYMQVRITGGSACSIASAMSDGIRIAPGANGAHIQDLYISCDLTGNGGHGLTIEPTANVDVRGLVLENSTLEGNGGFGARVLLTNSGRIENVVVRGTVFRQNALGGFRLAIRPISGAVANDLRTVLIADSIAEENGGSGFELEVRSGDQPSSTPNVMGVAFQNVTATGNSASGIRVATQTGIISGALPGGDVIDVRIENSTLAGNGRHGILLEAQRNLVGVVIKGNAIQGNGTTAPRGWGIRLHALRASVENVQIGGSPNLGEDNLVEGNGEGGIQIQANTTLNAVTILNNTIQANPRRGIHLLVATASPGSGPIVSIRGNLISGANSTPPDPEGVGILVEAKGVEIRGNDIRDNTIGVKVLQNEQLVIRENNIVNNAVWGVDGTAVSPSVVDARQNWWGDPNGPGNAPPNGVTDNVDASNPLPEEMQGISSMVIFIDRAELEPGGAGLLAISVIGVEDPGLAGFQVGPTGKLTFDPNVIQIVDVNAVMPYEILSKDIDNAGGVVRFAVSNPTGSNYLVGQGPVVVLQIEAAPNAQVGDSTVVTIDQVDVIEAPSGNGGTLPLAAPTIVDGRVEIVAQLSFVPGDVSGDGSVDVTDARMAAEAAIGVRTLSSEEQQRADVAPPFGVIDVTDARFIAELALGLRSSGIFQDASFALKSDRQRLESSIRAVFTPRGIRFYPGRPIANLTALRVEIYDVSGRRIFRSAWQRSLGSPLYWNLRRHDGRPVANGVYLYVIAARDRDGRLLRSEVKKLILLR